MQGSGNNFESDVGFRQPPRSARASNMNCSTGHQIIIAAKLYQKGR